LRSILHIRAGGRAPVRGSRLRWLSRHRDVALLAALWLLYVASFTPLALLGEDDQRPFTFLRALFGETKTKDAYQFGLAFFEAPFYGFAKLLSLAGLKEVGGYTLGPALITLGVALVVVTATVALVMRILSGLRLPAPALAAGAALFGSPLFFYGAIQPGKTHAVDALLFTVLVGLVFLYFREAARPGLLPIAMGAVLGVSVTVRYFTGASGAALVVAFLWYRRWRDGALFVATAAATAGVLAFVPYLTAGNSLGEAAGPKASGVSPAVHVLRWAPANPLRMLFSVQHGLYFWTPVTLLATVGFVRLLLRQRADRPFLAVAGLMGLAVPAAYVFSPYWSGAVGFSDRYLTSLYPLFAIGVASLVQWLRRFAVAAVCLAAAWSVWLGFYVAFPLGYDADTGTAFTSTADVASGKLRLGSVAHQIYCGWKLRHLAPVWSNAHCPRRQSSAVKNASAFGVGR
jgi:hypothetical protein